MAAPDGEPVSLRVQAGVYGLGSFATTAHFMAVTIVPLWVLQLELSPLWLGIVLGARPVLPLFLSIPTGALMDRIGARRVMLVFGALCLVTPLLYPLMPWVWAVIMLQMLWGLADSMGWLGAQTLVGQRMRGRTLYAGRLSFASRAGNIIGPPLVGAAWDLAGPWGAFGLCGVWGLGVLISAWILPADEDGRQAAQPMRERRGMSWRILLPSLSDYTASFRLLAVPTIAITVAISMMVHVGNNIQGTFYIVWLNLSGISGTLIGALISIASIAASIGSLLAAPLSRAIRSYWLLWGSVLLALILIAITPVLGVFLIFAVVLALRGLVNGIHQPLVITLMLKTVGPEAKGKAMGLRATANRVTSIGAPVLMGAMAEFVGIELSFYIIGLLASAAMIWIALIMRRHPEIHTNAEEARG